VVTDTLPIYEQAIAARYHHPNTIERYPEEPTVDLAQALKTDWNDVIAKIREGADKAEAFAEQRLPEAAQALDTAAGNPAIASLMAAVHIPSSTLTAIAATIDDLEQRFAALTQAPADAEPTDSQPADDTAPPAPAESVFVPQAGPVVGGQAQ
jgi:hypothetical protein